MPNDAYPTSEPDQEILDSAAEHAVTLESGQEGFLDFREYGLMALEIKRLKNTLKKMEDDLKNRQRKIMHLLTQQGLRGATLDDLNLTVFIHSQIFARARFPYTARDVIVALKETGHSDLVYETYNTSRISDWVRELERRHEDALADGTPGVEEVAQVADLLDPRLAEVLDVEPTNRIQTCAATRKRR